MNDSVLVGITVGIVIFLQIIFFFKTRKSIKKFSKILFVGEANWDTEELESKKIIRSDLSQGNSDGYKILQSVNDYIKNDDSPNFDTVKDIVERHSDILEENINHTLTVPLYLGLMGTIVGIIFGLWGIKLVDGNINPQSLLDGVKIAMFASACGLLFTVINSSISFSTAKKDAEEGKNVFYNWLLSGSNLVNDGDLSSRLEGLSISFSGFSKNLDRLQDFFANSVSGQRDVIDSSRKLMESINSSNVAEIKKYNIKVLHELNNSIEKFKEFNASLDLDGLYKLSDKMGDLNGIIESLNRLTERTQNFEELAKKIEGNVIDNRKLTEFLYRTFAELENLRDNFKQAEEQTHRETIKIADEINSSFKNLGDEFNKKIEELTDKIAISIATGSDEAGQSLNEFKNYINDFDAKIKDNVAQVSASVGFGLKESFEAILNQVKLLEEGTKNLNMENWVCKKLENIGEKISEFTNREVEARSRGLQVWTENEIGALSKKLQNLIQDAKPLDNQISESQIEKLNEISQQMLVLCENTKPIFSIIKNKLITRN